MKFEELSLCEPLLRSLQDAGYETATPIQQKAIPQILKGRDIVGCAQTGTGKTAAFALPTLQLLKESPAEPTGAERRRQRSGQRPIRCLILSPTRELASQIGESLTTYGRFTGLRHTVIYGGVGQSPQVRALQAGVDILVATPGRLLDLIGQGFVDLAKVEILILDEADQMLDMGFIHDLRKIVSKVPSERQTLMFSATMPPPIRKLAEQWLKRPFEVRVAAVASTPELVDQAVYFVQRPDKAASLTRFLNATARSRTLVFSRTKRGADRIARILQRDGIRAISIHGDKSQSRRTAAIREFGSDRPPVLVATDLAARGLDFSDVSHVINYDLPDTPETYVHRIGRTARAGASGKAISFCDADERKQLRMIEKLTGQAVPVKKLPGGTTAQKAQPAATVTDEAETTNHRPGSRRVKQRPPKRRVRSSSQGSRSPTSNTSGSARKRKSVKSVGNAQRERSPVVNAS
ncbi:MAG: DEAD/DEAH box helicase [Planctomycetaceae bacterium]|nr:DEAD/DEAH box helicase [Planctomycetales bacterium]MCB9938280.1 DEAD/DEAH box helicase [Planctomycetaceae bacterium]